MGSTIWSISREEKEKLITTLTPELVVLRAKAGVSQEELSDLIGVPRQTYSAIERGAKQMSWSTFLSLVLFYDCNQKTHEVLREPLNKSSAALSGPFAPTYRFENLEIHKVFLRFPNLNLEQNPSLTTLAI